MLLELRFSICTLGLGAGTFLAALYGMNLKNFMEESDFGFWGVSIFSSIIGGMVLIYGFKVLRRVQKVSMWGHHEPDRGSMMGRGRNTLPPLPPIPPLPPKNTAPVRAAVEAGKAARKSAGEKGGLCGGGGGWLVGIVVAAVVVVELFVPPKINVVLAIRRQNSLTNLRQ